MRGKRSIIGVAALLAALGAAEPAVATFPGQNGPLIWQEGDGAANIVRVRTVGDAGRSVTMPEFGFDISASPRGNSLVLGGANDNLLTFSSLRGGLLGSRAGGPALFCPFGVAYAPDARSVAVVGPTGEFGGCIGDHIYVSSPGSAPLPLRESDEPGPGTTEFVDWSPDGDTLALVRDEMDGSKLFTMPAGGGPESTLLEDTVGGLAIGSPSFSPDSSKIAFDFFGMDVDGQEPDDAGIAVIDADGSGSPQILKSYPYDSDDFFFNPVFSPDGERIAMLRRTFPTFDTHVESVVVMDADGGPVATVESNTDGAYFQSLEWAVRDEVDPVLSDASVFPARIRRRRRGTASFRLSEPATIELFVDGSKLLQREASPGLNRIVFPSRRNGRFLAPGRHLLKLAATDGQGNKARSRTASFRIKRKRRHR